MAARSPKSEGGDGSGREAGRAPIRIEGLAAGDVSPPSRGGPPSPETAGSLLAAWQNPPAAAARAPGGFRARIRLEEIPGIRLDEI